MTGGAVRVGAAIATALSDAGMSVCIHYGSNSDAAEKLLSVLRHANRRATAVSADLSRPDAAAKTIVDHCVRELGVPSVLVNSASIFERGTLASTTPDDWRRHLAINLLAPASLCREFVAARGDSRQHIVNIVDQWVDRPRTGHLAYSISKSGLGSLTRLLALELAPDVQVNAVGPGAVLPQPHNLDEHRRRAETAIPLRHGGSPRDVSDAVVYLLRSDFVTGQIVTVSGGESL